MTEFFLKLLERLTDGPPVVAPPFAHIPSSPSGKALVAVRKGYDVQNVADTRPPMPGRRHSFADVQSFADFILRHYELVASNVEILADETRIVAVNQQGWWRDEIECRIALHPGWVAISKLLNQPLPHKRLVRELHALSAYVTDPTLVVQLQKVDFSQATEAASSVTENGNYELLAKRQTTQSTVKLPGRFVVAVPVYLNGPVVEFAVGLIVEDVGTGEAPTVFSLRPINAEEVRLHAYQDQVQRLRDALGPAFLVGAGKLAFEQ